MKSDTPYIVVALVIAMVMHELSHGLVAKFFGDTTAQNAGRLTLNPIKHIDPMGSIVVPLVLAAGQMAAIGHIQFLYGWAKPIPVQALQLRWKGVQHPRQLMAVVAFAGPAMNFLLALLGGVLLYTNVLPVFFLYFILINLTIGIFNLLPVPPMDGGRIAVGLLPLPVARVYARAERFGIMAVLLLLFVLPTVAGQFGAHFDPFRDGMNRVMPWAVRQVLWITGHGAANGI
jgi:Zn-dependent protease